MKLSNHLTVYSVRVFVVFMWSIGRYVCSVCPLVVCFSARQMPISYALKSRYKARLGSGQWFYIANVLNRVVERF